MPRLDIYGPIIDRMMIEITADRPPEGSQWCNMTLGRPLNETPFFQASLLPLRFALEGEPRDLLLALLLSPFYGLWQGRHHAVSRVDLHWRNSLVDAHYDSLADCIRRADSGLFSLLSHERLSILKEIKNFHAGPRRRLSQWIVLMRRIWQTLEFPVIAGEEERLAWNHLACVCVCVCVVYVYVLCVRACVRVCVCVLLLLCWVGLWLGVVGGCRNGHPAQGVDGQIFQLEIPCLFSQEKWREHEGSSPCARFLHIVLLLF